MFESYRGEKPAILLMSVLNEQAKVAVSNALITKSALQKLKWQIL